MRFNEEIPVRSLPLYQHSIIYRHQSAAVIGGSASGYQNI